MKHFISTPAWKSRPIASLAILLIAQLIATAALAQTHPRLSSPGNGIVRALIVGINEYESKPSLKGAVADARDIETTLRKYGVTDLRVLIDSDATRRAIEEAMSGLVARARQGDFVIITFAGHGAQEPERVIGSEADGLDEVFLLGGFRSVGRGSAERILDKEINHWLLQLERKNVDVLFVADTCFGGGLVRGIDPRVEEISYRGTGRIQVLEDELKPISTRADNLAKEADFTRITFLSAADEATKVPEVRIPGVPGLRGALSYAVARAIEGAVERDHDGRVSRRKLFEYTRQIVYQYSQTRQIIWTEPTRSASMLNVAAFRAQGPMHSPMPARAPVRIRFLGAEGDPLAGAISLQVPFRAARDGEPADLIWDAARREVVSATGDIIARGVSLRELPAIVDRTAALQLIEKLAESNPQTIMIKPNDRHHRDGASIMFRAESIAGKFVILFNIAYDGTIQRLFPLAGDALRVERTALEFPLRVKAPFGADHVVAIVSDIRLDQVERSIRELDGRRAAGALFEILLALRASSGLVRLGTAGIFTIP